MSSQTQDKREDVIASVRLPRAQHERLQAAARNEHRTVSGHLRFLIQQHLDAEPAA